MKIMIFLMLLILTTPALAVNLGQDVIIKSNETSLGYYQINQTFNANLLEVNDSSVTFTFNNDSMIYDTTNGVSLTPLCLTCVLNSLDSIIGIKLIGEITTAITGAMFRMGLSPIGMLATGLIVGLLIALVFSQYRATKKNKTED